MRKSYQYRLFPTKHQETLLLKILDECRWLYNHFLAERKETYEKTGKSLGLYGQQATIPVLKEQRPTLNTVHSQVLQNVAVRVDLAFQAFFRRIKAGDKPGYPRFKGKGWYDSVTFPQAPVGCKLDKDKLYLSKIGAIQVILHRPLEGKPKTCTVKRTSTGKWFVSFSCEVLKLEPLPPSKEEVGIDVGLSTFATFSNGEKIKRKRFFNTDQRRLAKAQRRFSREAKGTRERKRRRKPVARIYERIANRRRDFAHQQVHRIVSRFGFIAVEDLEVNRMIHEGCYAKSIHDTAWSLFFTLLFVKAANAGRTVVKVNPAYTSQTCSGCGHRQKMPLNKRIYSCPCCKLRIDRDHNAALNILKIGLGQQPVGPIPRSP